jgi:hypothetical protein
VSGTRAAPILGMFDLSRPFVSVARGAAKGAFKGAAEGALGGMLGTWFIQRAMTLSQRLPESLQGPEVREDPGQFIVRKLHVAPALREPLAKSLHWVYGTTWPLVLGTLAPRLRHKGWSQLLLAGAGLGAAVWAVGYLGWLPATGLTKPIYKEKVSRTTSGLLGHIFYGVLAAVPTLVEEQLLHRRPRGWRRWFG